MPRSFSGLRLTLGAILLAAAACESRNSPFSPGTSGSDRTAPTVVSTVPANVATQVGLSSPMTITFSEPMAPASITTTSISFSPAIAGTVSYSGNVATFTPTAALATGTSYTGTISTVVEDLAGNRLVTPFIWSFSTAAPESGIFP